MRRLQVDAMLAEVARQALQVKLSTIAKWTQRYSGPLLPPIEVPREGGRCSGCHCEIPGYMRLERACRRISSKPKCAEWSVGL